MGAAWARVEALEVPGWRARRIASATIGLSVEEAAAVDIALAPRADTCGTRAIDQVIATTDPAEQKQTEDLAPLCRRHHPAKTRRRWRYQREPDGSYLWIGPHGRQYHVDAHGTSPVAP